MILKYKSLTLTFTESYFVEGLFLIAKDYEDNQESDFNELIESVNNLYDAEQPNERWKVKYEFVKFDDDTYHFTSNNIRFKTSFENVRKKLIEAGCEVIQDHTR